MALHEKERVSADIAREHYQEGKPQAEIARERGLHPSTVSRHLRYAIDTGIVRFEISHEKDKRCKRQNHLERELVSEFGLRDAIVIELPPSAAGKGVGTVGEKKQDDELHKYLGKANARYLRTILRTDDHIATGGGRAIYNTAIELVRLSVPPNIPLNQENVVITSVNGNSDTRVRARKTPDPDANMPLDSDTVVVHMGRAFAAGATPNRMCLPLVNSPADVERFRRKQGSVLGNDFWGSDQKRRPSIILFGIGAFLGSHRFVEPEGPVLGYIKPHLTMLKESADQLGSISNYIPVADICNRLFFIPPPNGDDTSPPVRSLIEKIEREIAEINKHMLTIDFEQLASVNTGIAVAGGKNKWDAIYYTLTDFEPRGIVDVLVTDKATAETLITWNSLGSRFRPS